MNFPQISQEKCKKCMKKEDREGSTAGLYPGVLYYSVTQSYANSFWRDVVLETSKNVSRDEDNILDQIYIKHICSENIHIYVQGHAMKENSYGQNVVFVSDFGEH